MPPLGAVELALAPGVGTEIGTFADLDSYLGSVATAGFPSVSLGLQQVAFAIEERGGLDRVHGLLRTHGLRVHDVLSVAVRRDTDAALSTAADLARLASAVGAEYVLVLLMTRLSDDGVNLLSSVADIVSEAGARLAFEFTPKSPVSNVDAALDLVEQIGSDRMGVMIDSWHFFRGDSTWKELETIPLDRLAYVQFNDSLPAASDDVLSETLNRRTWPGQGEFDLGRFASTLRDRGWAGLVSVEVLSEEHRRLSVDEFTTLAYDTTTPYWSGVS